MAERLEPQALAEIQERADKYNPRYEDVYALLREVTRLQGLIDQQTQRVAAAQRYDMVTNYRCGESIDELERSDDGEWCRWEDVAELPVSESSR